MLNFIILLIVLDCVLEGTSMVMIFDDLRGIILDMSQN